MVAVAVAVAVVVVVVVVVAVAVGVVVGVVVAVAVAVVVAVAVAVVKGGAMGKVLSPLSVGKKVIVRLVTHYYTGCVVKLTAQEIILSDAAWIADTGRWADALSKGTLSEVEPFPGLVTLNRGALVDASEWLHDLPRKQK